MNDLQFSSLPQWPKGYSVPQEPQRLVCADFPYTQEEADDY